MAENFLEGMRFAFKRSNSPVAYCAISVRTGSRDENPNESGIAHLTEHLVFKGTKFRTAASINSYIDSLGGELNAYTTKEETVIHSTVLKEDIAKAINLVLELAFCPIFPEKELEKEKVVILDEISSYKDSPDELIFDDFEELLFKGTPLSSPVLGKSSFVKKCTVEHIRRYHQKMFVPANCCFTIVADLEENKVKKILEKSLKKYLLHGAVAPQIDEKKTKELMPTRERFTKVINKRNHQVHCIIGGDAYSYYQRERIPLILLINMLGGPSANSRLNLSLREKNALVYNVEASYSQYCDTGAVTIYFGCDKSNYEKCVHLVKRELERFREEKVSPKRLKEAKKQFLGQMAISEDNGEARCLSMGKSLMVFNELFPMEKVRELVEAITPEELQFVAQDIFREERLSILTYH